MKSRRIATLTAAIASAAIGVAAPASADLSEGGYTWTLTAGGPAGFHAPWVVSACGQNCMTVRFQNGSTTDFHRQGASWTATGPSNGCDYTLDNNSLTGRQTCPDGSSAEWRLTKDG